MPQLESDIGRERRVYHRYALPLNFVTNSGSGDNAKDRLFNISKGGACFVSDDHFNQNDFIMLNFSTHKDMPVDEIQFSVVGKIVWVNKRSDNDAPTYGARFEIYDDPFSKQQYSQLISTINKFVSFSSAYRDN